MKHYTIRSKSAEGTYFLVNHWNTHKAFWKDANSYGKSMMFNRQCDEKRSLTHLLNIMPDYLTDEFEMMECRYSEWKDAWVFKELYKINV